MLLVIAVVSFAVTSCLWGASPTGGCGGNAEATYGTISTTWGDCPDPCDPDLIDRVRAEALLDAMVLADALCGTGCVCTGTTVNSDDFDCETRTIVIDGVPFKWCHYWARIDLTGGSCVPSP